MGPGAADICEIIPEVREMLPDLEPASPLEPEQARFRLFDSITTLLRNVAESQPLMLVLDDLQWADQPSLLLLEFLARQVPASKIMVIGTYRDVEVTRAHPLSNTLAQLARSEAYHREELGGLEAESVGQLIRDVSGAEPSPELIQAIYGHTEGNPFFMTEVIRLLGQGHSTEDPQTDGFEELEIPQSVLEVIGQRLNRLSDECVSALTTGAVIGRQFDFRLLVKLSDETTETELLELVDEALAAYLIQEVPGQGDVYQFSHALVQQTLRERISTSRRVRLHARIGETLETLYGDQPGSHAAELAYHFAEAEPVLGPEKLVKYSLLAGERALSTYAYEEALVHFQRLLSAKEHQPDDTEMAAALFGLGRAQAAALGRQQLDEAFASMDRAFEIYAGLDDVAGALAVAEFPVHQIPGHHGGVDLVARALRLIAPDSQDTGRLLSRFVLGKGLGQGDYKGATEAFDSALAIAQGNGDLALETRTLAHSSNVDYWHLHIQETVAKGLRAIELAHQSDDQLSEVYARFWVGISLLTTGNSKEAKRHAAAMLAGAESLRGRYWLATALWLNEFVSRFEGNWQAAREFNRRGLLASPSDTRLLGTRILLEYETGNFVEGNEFIEDFVENLRLVTPGPRYDQGSAALMIPVVARITGAAEWLYIAEDAATTVLSAQFATPFITRSARCGLALVAVIRGDAELAKERYSALQSSAGTHLDCVNGDRVLGLVAQTIGEIEKATEHFEDALDFCRKAGFRPELAWTCHDYAAMLLSGGGSRTAPTDASDQEKIKALLEEALSISMELGMSPLMERATALQKLAAAQTVNAPAYPDGLSQREVEVLLLIAGGKSNREIAAELFISPNTDGHHVSNILNKIGAANRTEAASYANRQGLA